MEFDPNSNPPCYKTVDEVCFGCVCVCPLSLYAVDLKCHICQITITYFDYFASSSKDIVIQQDDEIRLKIVGTRVDKNDIVSVPHSQP